MAESPASDYSRVHLSTTLLLSDNFSYLATTLFTSSWWEWALRRVVAQLDKDEGCKGVEWLETWTREELEDIMLREGGTEWHFKVGGNLNKRRACRERGCLQDGRVEVEGDRGVWGWESGRGRAVHQQILERTCQGFYLQLIFGFSFEGCRRYLSPGPWSRWVKRFTELGLLLGQTDKVFKAWSLLCSIL